MPPALNSSNLKANVSAICPFFSSKCLEKPPLQRCILYLKAGSNLLPVKMLPNITIQLPIPISAQPGYFWYGVHYEVPHPLLPFQTIPHSPTPTPHTPSTPPPHPNSPFIPTSLPPLLLRYIPPQPSTFVNIIPPRGIRLKGGAGGVRMDGRLPRLCFSFSSSIT